jgi:hypothetical protein
MNRLKLVKPTSMGAAIPNSASPGPILTHYTHCADHLAPLTESYLELLAWECVRQILECFFLLSQGVPRWSIRERPANIRSLHEDGFHSQGQDGVEATPVERDRNFISSRIDTILALLPTLCQMTPKIPNLDSATRFP